MPVLRAGKLLVIVCMGSLLCGCFGREHTSSPVNTWPVSEMDIPVLTDQWQLPDHVGQIVTIRVTDLDPDAPPSKQATLMGVGVADYRELKSSYLQATGVLESFVVTEGPCETCDNAPFSVAHACLAPGTHYRLRDVNGVQLARVQFAVHN